MGESKRDGGERYWEQERNGENGLENMRDREEKKLIFKKVETMGQLNSKCNFFDFNGLQQG